MRLAAVLLLLTACQDDIVTPFPPGLEPLEDNIVPDGPVGETLRFKTTDTDIIRVYARGFVQLPLTTVWAAAKSSTPNVSTCRTDERIVTENDEPQYEYSFLVHYIVHDILTVEWDDQWRFGLVTEKLGMIRHQKIQGSDFVRLSEGTIQVLATDDPEVTELAFVEHLDATSATTADVTQGVQHNYDALVATAHGTPIPPCP